MGWPRISPDLSQAKNLWNPIPILENMMKIETIVENFKNWVNSMPTLIKAFIKSKGPTKKCKANF